MEALRCPGYINTVNFIVNNNVAKIISGWTASDSGWTEGIKMINCQLEITLESCLIKTEDEHNDFVF